MHVIAIGGGEFRRRETDRIDTRVLDATDADRPRVLFVPTASGDAEGYCESFRDHYERLGATVDVLRLARETPDAAEVRAALAPADAVYVGGGDTALMLERWAELGADALLREAAAAGTVVAGLSAGALAPFARGLGDPGDDGHVRVRGLGLVPFAVVPHADRERRRAFARTLRGAWARRVGVALEDRAAIEVHDGRVRALTDGGDVYRYFPTDGGLCYDRMTPEEWRPVAAVGADVGCD